SPGRRGRRPRARALLALKRDFPDSGVFAAPGNPGTGQLGTNLAIPVSATADLVAAAREYKIDFTIVGPEAPLAAGLAGALPAAARAARPMLVAAAFADAAREIEIEDFVKGEQPSLLALTDGEQLLLLPAAQDHKRLGEGDTGPNTGRMGAYCPVNVATPGML